MKVLKGSLKETLYNWPDPKAVAEGVPSPPTVQKETMFEENEVTYISGALRGSCYDHVGMADGIPDKIGLHRISNRDPEKVAVSLHRKHSPGQSKMCIADILQCIRHRMAVATASTRGQEGQLTLSNACFTRIWDIACEQGQ
jgi:Cysteine dioxygenase type I